MYVCNNIIFAVNQVIAYMTLGIDVSRLFSEMVLCVDTKDIILKKMVYLYLTNYAQQNSELAIMCINTLLNDWYALTPICNCNCNAF